VKAGVASTAIAAGIVMLVSGCETTRTPDEAEVKQLLRQLPYRFEFRPVDPPDGASGAVAGRVIGPHRTVVHFGISLGHDGDPVPLGPGTDTADATGGETFRVTDDTMVIVNGKLKAGHQFHTDAQWNESARIVVDIEEKLCRATTGKPCAI
jgi:hypothetical protein